MKGKGGHFTIAGVFISAAVLMVSCLIYYSSVALTRKLVTINQDKILAESFASELTEYFRGISVASLESYLMTNPITLETDLGSRYYYCAHIGILDRSTGQVRNPDPIAYLPDTRLDRSPSATCSTVSKANRWYQVMVVDKATLTPDKSFCTFRFGEREIQDIQTYLVTVGVSYFNTGKDGCEESPVRVTTQTMMLRDLHCDYKTNPSWCPSPSPTPTPAPSPPACQPECQYLVTPAYCSPTGSPLTEVPPWDPSHSCQEYRNREGCLKSACEQCGQYYSAPLCPRSPPQPGCCEGFDLGCQDPTPPSSAGGFCLTPATVQCGVPCDEGTGPGSGCYRPKWYNLFNCPLAPPVPIRKRNSGGD